METRQTVYERITTTVIAAIEAGAGNFAMPWHTDGSDTARPTNIASGRPYRGINTLALWVAAQAAGYGPGIWGTYKQWAERGAQVRKGEKSTLVVFWKINDREQDADDAAAEDTARRRIVARGYSVFNAAQVDGYAAPAMPVLPEMQRIERAERWFAALGATVREGGSRAFYQPNTDAICLPPFAAFRDPVAYYATLAHEATHWSGHADRCARDLKGRFGSESYAAEELVAELGAAFLCADLALASEPRPDHAAYIASWLKVLRDDPRAIFTAAAKAQAAADWMHARQG
jgi:antirestriction protein ArdC